MSVKFIEKFKYLYNNLNEIILINNKKKKIKIYLNYWTTEILVLKKIM